MMFKRQVGNSELLKAGARDLLPLGTLKGIPNLSEHEDYLEKGEVLG